MLDKALIPLYESNSDPSQLIMTIFNNTASLPYRLIYIISFIFMLITTLTIFNLKSVKEIV